MSADVRAALARHGRAWPALDSTARSAQRLLDEGLQKQRAVAGELARLSVPPDVTALQRALERIRPDGRLEVTRDTRVRESVVIEDEARATLLALGLGGDLAGADALSLPDGATVDAVDGARRDAEARLAECTTEHDRLRRETEAYRRDLAALLATADPPSLQALHEARSRRDAGWRHVRGTWLGGGDSVLASQWAGEMPLPDAFELATNGADQIADRLRTEADTVATRALLEQNLAASDAALTEAGVWLGQAEDTVAEARAAWASLWTPLGLVPSGRVEMDRRLAQLRGVVANSARARAARADAAELAALVDRHREDLRALLIDSGVSVPDRLSLAALLDMATETCRRAESLRMQRSGHEQSAMTLADACRQYDADVTATAGAVARWREEWRGLVPAVGLSPEATPEELDAVLGLMPKLEAVHDAHEAVRQQIAGIEERNLAIHRRVAAVLAALPAHADLDATQPELAIAELQARVRRAQETDTGRRVQAARLARWQAEADTATRELGRCTVELATMARTAGLADEPALAAAVARTQQHETLGREARRLDEQLVAATGASPEDVAREVDAFQGMDVEAELATLTLQLTEVESHRNTCAVTVGRLQQERAQADASDAAAEAAAREEEALAALALQSDEYVRVALARALLQEEMAAYRDQHQGPVLARAGELFAELTLGRYRGIDTDVTDKGVVQLLARAGSGATVDVAGLSTGTRDQLYLALRLASLEQFAQQGRALPVILDDLFVHFDDQRTAAGLRVLAGLAGHMQVLLFTHHERVAAQARTELDTSQVTVLQLSGKA